MSWYKIKLLLITNIHEYTTCVYYNKLLVVQIISIQHLKISTSYYYKKNWEQLPPFCSTVLEPSLNVRVWDFERFGETCPFGWRQVFLSVEPFLQLNDGHPRKWGSGFLPFRRRSVLVRVPDSSCDWKRKENDNYPNLIYIED